MISHRGIPSSPALCAVHWLEMPCSACRRTKLARRVILACVFVSSAVAAGLALWALAR